MPKYPSIYQLYCFADCPFLGGIAIVPSWPLEFQHHRRYNQISLAGGHPRGQVWVGPALVHEYGAPHIRNEQLARPVALCAPTMGPLYTAI